MGEEERKEAGIPRMFRAMWPDGGHPRVGTDRDMLGARVPTDVKLVGADRVRPGNGMSVFRSIEEMPPFLIPKDYLSRFPEAGGKRGIKIWRLGEGAFANGPVTDNVVLRTSSAHGAMEPEREMPLDVYQAALAATRDGWVGL
jgi:hypothetical protein